jgi:avidin family protein
MDITGTWYNELGSKMVIEEVSEGGFYGTYHTTVSASKPPAEGVYVLSGRLTDEMADGSQAIGFVVAWQNAYGDRGSVTAWSGELQGSADGVVLRTTWLLTSSTKPDDDWKSTLIGTDVFTRTPPEVVANTAPSHPS